MEPMRKIGEKMEDAVGLPHHAHHTTAPGAPAAAAPKGPPDWATSDHYPGESHALRVYPDDSAPAATAAAPAHASTGGAPGKQHLNLEKMSPRAQAIVEEVGRELEESPSVIT